MLLINDDDNVDDDDDDDDDDTVGGQYQPSTLAVYRGINCRLCSRRQVMERTGRCVTVSESLPLLPVVYKYRKFGDSSELRQLARDVMRWECRPYPTIQPPPLCYFVKIYSRCFVALPMFK